MATRLPETDAVLLGVGLVGLTFTMAFLLPRRARPEE